MIIKNFLFWEVFEKATIDVYLHLQGIGLVWESYKLDPYVQRLAESVFNFQEKVNCKCYVTVRKMCSAMS